MALLHLDLRRRHSLQAWSAKPSGMSRSPNPAPRLRAKSEAAPDPKPDWPSERLASAEDELSSMVVDRKETKRACGGWGGVRRDGWRKVVDQGASVTRFGGRWKVCACCRCKWLGRTHDVLILTPACLSGPHSLAARWRRLARLLLTGCLGPWLLLSQHSPGTYPGLPGCMVGVFLGSSMLVWRAGMRGYVSVSQELGNFFTPTRRN